MMFLTKLLRPAACIGGLLLLVSSAASTPARGQTQTPAQALCDSAKITGGLCVMVGCQDPASAVTLAGTGRYLVHVLELEPAAVIAARARLRDASVYGLASAESLEQSGKLPYTENLVNAVFLGEEVGGRVPLAEIARVLRPEGVLFLAGKQFTDAEISAAGLADVRIAAKDLPWRMARKPWPRDMDAWSHARHAADGNAVSRDTQLGPPRRVRWVAGPQQEISNMVTAGGRAYFAGVLTRDAFNGLRLWERKLNPSPARGGFGFRALPGSVQPIATGNSLLVVTDQRLRALDADTGRELREFPEAGLPAEVLLEARTILAVDKTAVRAVDLDSGSLCWKQSAEEPRYAVVSEGSICFLQGDARPAESLRLVSRETAGGKLRWEKEFPWLLKVRRLVCHQGMLVCEISTLNDNKPGNMIRVLAAADGSPMWERVYVPGSSHYKQARALFAAGLLWLLEEKQCVGLDPRTGEVKKTHPALLSHCFPPVASARYLIAGEMHLTDLETGRLDGNPITKAACSRDAGIVPANGLLYTFPKHCICWPMLRDYAALAPERPGGMPKWEELRWMPERGPAAVPEVALEDPARQWPCYRHDALRSGGTAGSAPRDLKVLWTVALGGRPEGAIAEDWLSNYFIRGPVGPPVAANGLVYVTRPDAHQVVALDAGTGAPRWTFTANGRVDTAPTIHRGLCLFGCKSGWVYCLRGDDGQVVWRLRAAPLDERIVAYGQLESPWPVPGSVLVIDGTAYFAAGRQPLADGGVLVFAVDPATGTPRWVQRINSVPQTNFYASSGLEFDNFDLMHGEGDAVAMSRWLFDRATGKMTCRAKEGFARLGGESAVMFPRGAWSYAPRNETERSSERPFVRPLAVFRGNSLFGCSQDRLTVFRRDFQLDGDEKFDANWFHGWDTYKAAGKGGDLWQSQRVSRGAAWNVAPPAKTGGNKEPIAATLLAGDCLYTVGARGTLTVLDVKTGNAVSQLEVAPPAWDGLATAEGRVFLSTHDGGVMCLGEK